MRDMIRLLAVMADDRGRLARSVLWQLAVQVGTAALLVAPAAVVAQVAQERTLPTWQAAGLLALAVTVSLATWRESWVSHDLAYRVLGRLRDTVFSRLRLALPSREQPRHSAEAAGVAMRDVDEVEWLFAHTVAQGACSLVLVASCTALSWLVEPRLVLVWGPMLLVTSAIPTVLWRRADRDARRISVRRDELASAVVDTVRGMRDFTVSGSLERRLELLDRIDDDIARTRRADARRVGLERALADALLAVSGLGAVLLVAATADSVSAPLSYAVATAAIGPAAQLSDLLRNAGRLRVAAHRIVRSVDQVPTVVEPDHGRQVGYADGSLVFEDVTFGYRTDRPVLRGVSLRVGPGEIVALTGPSGSGKSTCVGLALRWWDPDHGRITLGGTDLRTIADTDLRRLVHVVPQGSALLRGTVESNIRLGHPDADSTDVHRVAREAGITDPAAGFVDGLATAVGERGDGLSGGQQARVALARAFLGNPAVLVLDEATASLDVDAAQAISEVLRHHPRRATLVVTHRREVVASADRVVRLPGTASGDQPARSAPDTPVGHQGQGS
ncbi:ABC transporter ATP-binding protein [Aeromicrobium sp. CTD01-1L150]|uniref:ABC transporter ATP-binding protein n=1 Tax=Aeromicrobium sp. CTD01-1L150 TaxID=3341830 RepID=UPI0035BEF275